MSEPSSSGAPFIKVENRKAGHMWVGDANHYLYVHWPDGVIVGDVRKLGGQEFVAHVRDKKLGRYCHVDLARDAVAGNIKLAEGDWDV